MSAPHITDVTDLRRELLASERNTSPRLSPDARSVAFLRTVDEGPEIWLRTADHSEHRLASHHGDMVTDLRWTADSTMLLYRHTPRGREHWCLAAVRVDSAERVTLAAGPVTEYWLARCDPAVVVYSRRVPGSPYSELFRIGLADSGAAGMLIAPNPGFHRWLVDGDLRPRGGTRLAEDGSVHLVLGDDLDTARTVLKIEAEEAADLSIQEFSRDGRRLFILTSYGATTRRLISVDSASATLTIIFADPHLDVESYPIAGEGAWFDPRTGEPDICAVMGQRLRYHALASSRREAAAHLATLADDVAVIVDRSADDSTWLVVYVHDDGPIAYHTFDPATGASQPLLVNRPELAGYRLARLEDFCFVASDGWELSGYAMRPLDGELPLPTVVMVHGGPAGRDMWRFHADAQYLASLGYLSLHVNYRGSRGFGVEFRQAGNGEWGGRMQQDLYDAVATGVSAGLVDPARVAFLGGSYGGYAALLAACTRPDLVRCAIAISAPCDLVSFVRNPPPYWQPLSILLRRQIQPYEDRQLDETALERRSPMHTLDRSCAPVLLAHGVRDPRVPVADADRFAARAGALGVPIRYLRFADEGHHVKSNANRATLFKNTEEFLEEHLAAR
jgi:dipeptidyl aminopeptidase/acylaminoacyl peptidase